MTAQLLAQDLPEVWHLLSAPQRHAAIDWLGVGEVTVQVGDQVIVETRLRESGSVQMVWRSVNFRRWP